MKKCNNCNMEYEDNEMYCEKCGNKLTFFEADSNKEENNEKAKHRKDKMKIALTLLCIIETIALVISVSLCIYFEDDRDYQSYQKFLCMRDYDNLKEDYDFYYDNSAMIDVIDGLDDGYYHKFDCKNCEFEYFLIFNTAYAEQEGYLPCPECWEN